jgi:excinuclease ABC subunit A
MRSASHLRLASRPRYQWRSAKIKIASHLGSQGGERCCVLDEPTTGLHFDVVKLLAAFRKLLAAGHSLLVIEHNLEMRDSGLIIDPG